jgi:hypothetical protein
MTTGKEPEEKEPKVIKHKFKKDRYANARGGSSEFLDIYCGSCKTHLALYQKDGPGSLLRMYLDRIFEPQDLAKLQDVERKEKIPNLVCPCCHTLIAVPMVYKPENREALRLIRGTFFKKKSKGIYYPEQNVITNNL